MSLDPTVRDALLLAALAIAVVALGWTVALSVRLRRMRRDYALLQATDDAMSFIEVVARKTEEVSGLRAEVQRLDATLSRTRTELADAIRHVSVVRYDAFGDMGGRLSFSAALLDDGGDGLVMSSIHGRSETRLYVKGVQSGGSESPLSPEEQQAVSYALNGLPR